MSVTASIWPIPTPPATALDVDLAPVITVTTLLDGVPTAGVLVSAGGSVTPVTSGVGGVAVLGPVDNGPYTVAAGGAGATWTTADVEVLDESVSVSLAGTTIIPDPAPITVAADILAVRLPAVEAISSEESLPELWFADYGLTTDLDDTPSATVIEERLVGEVRYRARVVPLVWGRGEGAAPVGQITLANGDGALDPIVGAGWTGRVAEIYRGDREQPVSEWTLLVRTRLAAPPAAGDEETVTLTMGSIADRLDQPLQSEVFPDDTTAEALRGQARPFGAGYCYSVPAVLVDPPNLRYEVHDGTTLTVERVRAAGNELDPMTEWTASARGFTLDTNPFGSRVVADVLFGADPDAETVILDLLARAGIEPADVATDTLPLTTPLGVWSGSPATGSDLLAYALDSFAAGWYVDRLDRIAVWQLSDTLPSVPGRRITEDDLTDRQLAVVPDTAPGYVDVIAGGRNWHVHAPTELAGALIDPTITQTAIDLQADYRFRRRGDETAPLPPADPGDGYVTRPGGGSPRKPAEADGNGIGTALVEAADVSAEAVRLREIFAADRLHRFADLEITADLLDVWIGQWVELDLPRFGLSVVEGVVVGIDAELGTGACLLSVWLPGPVPPGLPAPV